MNILITGAFGFIGTNLSKANLRHYLIALDLLEPANNVYNDFFSWNELDLIDWDKIDVIIHLAGKAHDTKNTTEEKNYFDINVGLTQQIFKYFLQSNASKFIFFSSIKAVVDKVPGEQLTEEDIQNPQTPYGKSKLAAEKYLLGQFLPKNKKVYILRPCMIHGSGNKGNLNLLYRFVLRGIPWPLGSFNNKRSFISIDNLIFIINQIIEREIEEGIYQIADDEPISTNRLIQLIAKSKSKKSRIWKLNKDIVHTTAKIGDIIHLPLNSERLKKLTESYVVSNKKLRKALRIENLPVGAEEGMKKTLASF